MQVQLNGVTYEYEVTGSGEPLLLLHGFTGSIETWRRFFPSWGKNLQIIAVDLLGHGKTEHPSNYERYRIELVAADMVALLDYLHISKVHILGYSMGGRLALTIACLYPDRLRSLVLENCTPGLEDEQERAVRRQQDEKLANFIIENGIEAFVQHWEDVPLFATQKHLPHDVQQSIRQQRLQNHSLGLANSLRGMGTGAQPSWWSSLQQITIPVLLLGGEYDTKFLHILQRMQTELPQAVFTQISGAGHAIHVEQPEKFDTIVRGFFQTQT